MKLKTYTSLICFLFMFQIMIDFCYSQQGQSMFDYPKEVLNKANEIYRSVYKHLIEYYDEMVTKLGNIVDESDIRWTSIYNMTMSRINKLQTMSGATKECGNKILRELENSGTTINDIIRKCENHGNNLVSKLKLDINRKMESNMERYEKLDKFASKCGKPNMLATAICAFKQRNDLADIFFELVKTFKEILNLAFSSGSNILLEAKECVTYAYDKEYDQLQAMTKRVDECFEKF